MLRLVAALVLAYGITMLLVWICPFSALVGQKKTFVSWLAKKSAARRCQSPKPEGARKRARRAGCVARSCTSGIDRRSRAERRVRLETNAERQGQPNAAPHGFSVGRYGAGTDGMRRPVQALWEYGFRMSFTAGGNSDEDSQTKDRRTTTHDWLGPRG